MGPQCHSMYSPVNRWQYVDCCVLLTSTARAIIEYFRWLYIACSRRVNRKSN